MNKEHSLGCFTICHVQSSPLLSNAITSSYINSSDVFRSFLESYNEVRLLPHIKLMEVLSLKIWAQSIQPFLNNCLDSKNARLRDFSFQD